MVYATPGKSVAVAGKITGAELVVSPLEAAPPPPHDPRITDAATTEAAIASREDSLRNASKFTIDSLSLAPARATLQKS
jgi:hypothetical protein